MVARKLCLQLCQQHCIFAWMKTLVVGSSFTYFTRKSDSPLCLYGKRLDHVFKKRLQNVCLLDVKAWMCFDSIMHGNRNLAKYGGS